MIAVGFVEEKEWIAIPGQKRLYKKKEKKKRRVCFSTGVNG